MSEEGRVRGSDERSNLIEGKGENVGFQEARVSSDVREFRQRCKTKVKLDVREEVCEARDLWYGRPR